METPARLAARRARYYANLERERQRCRTYYQEHRTERLAKAKSRGSNPAPPKPCKRCHVNLTPSARHWYCEPCGQIAKVMTGRKTHLQSTTARGYGADHQRIRRQWTPLVQTGQVCCAYCNELILPDEQWDLGHSDTDRTQYVGPEHARCNRKSATRQRQQRTLKARGGGSDLHANSAVDPDLDQKTPRLRVRPPKAA